MRGWRAAALLRSVALLLAVYLSVAPACRADFADIDRAMREGNAANVLADLRRQADAGDADAAFDLGLLYDLGRGVPEDFSAALQWYERAAALGNATAAFNAGVLYDSGRGVPVNRGEAVRWYARAAQQGFGRAEYALGLMYARGDGVRRDLPKARTYFEAAARHGVEAARGQLALLAKAEDTNGEVAFAQVEAQILAHGLSGLDTDAVRKLRVAAQKGNALAQYDLAYCYENGIGQPVDRVAAFVWYSRSASAAAPAAAKAAATAGARAMRAQMSATEQQVAEAMLRPAGR